MIPFRPRATEQSSPSSQTRQSTEPRKPSVENDHPLERVEEGDDRDASEEASQVVVSLEGLSSETYEPRPPPPAPPSEAAPSSGGKSLSCPTEGDLYDRPKVEKGKDFLHMLFDHDSYDQDVRLQALELPSASADSETNGNDTGPRPWKFEFTWERDLLLFDGETLSTQRSTDSPSEGSGAVVGGSSLASATGHTVQESMLSVGTTNTLALEMACFREGEIQRAITERRQFLIDILEEHYFRAHPPQRSGGRKSSNRHSGIDTSSRTSSSKGGSSAINARRITGSTRGKGITGDGGDEEDEEDNTAPNGTPQSASVSADPYFACPYLKWKPQKYEKCFLRFRTISHMIGHLEEKHFSNRCSTCWISFATPTEMKMHKRKSCYGAVFAHPASLEPDEITDEQWVEIKKRPGRKYQCPDSRWRHIFKILFPESPLPTSIYCGGKFMNELMDSLLSYSRREGTKILADLQDELSREDRLLLSEPRDEQTRAVLEGFINQSFTRIVSGFMSDGDSATEYSRQDDQNDLLESQIQTGGISVYGDRITGAAKQKSVRFVEPGMDSYASLPILTEEVTPSSAIANSSTAQSQHSSKTSSPLPSEPLTEFVSSSGNNPDDEFVQFTVGGDYSTKMSPQPPFQMEEQRQLDLLDLDLSHSQARDDPAIRLGIDAVYTLDLELQNLSTDMDSTMHTNFPNHCLFSNMDFSTSYDSHVGRDYLEGSESIGALQKHASSELVQDVSRQAIISPASDNINKHGGLNSHLPWSLNDLDLPNFPLFDSSWPL